jgi:hypothetical protein
MLLHRKGKLTIAKLKSLRLSYSEVISLPLESILSKISRYEADLSDSVVSFISSSLDISSGHDSEKILLHMNIKISLLIKEHN